MMINLGTLDRAVRIVVGMVLLSLVVVGPRTFWGFIGFVPLMTGAMGYCPLYRVLGFSSSFRARWQARVARGSR
jgi:hypothetical protein